MFFFFALAAVPTTMGRGSRLPLLVRGPRNHVHPVPRPARPRHPVRRPPSPRQAVSLRAWRGGGARAGEQAQERRALVFGAPRHSRRRVGGAPSRHHAPRLPPPFVLSRHAAIHTHDRAGLVLACACPPLSNSTALTWSRSPKRSGSRDESSRPCTCSLGPLTGVRVWPLDMVMRWCRVGGRDGGTTKRVEKKGNWCEQSLFGVHSSRDKPLFLPRT